MLTRMEKVELSFTSPTLFYGYTEQVDVTIDYVRDKYGRRVRNEKGAFITKKKEVHRTYPCAFSLREDVLHKLEETYFWWKRLHPNHNYPPFSDCIREEKPVCPRVNPELHGVKLIMNPFN